MKRRQFDIILYWLKEISLHGIVITLAFSRLNFNSICIIALLFTWLVDRGMWVKLKTIFSNTIFIASALYFLLHLVGIFYTEDRFQGWKHMESKVGFLIIPAMLCSGFINVVERKQLMKTFVVALTASALYCLIVSAFRYSESGNSELLFYHNLVSPVEHHAIYFSVLVFIALAFLTLPENRLSFFPRNRLLLSVWIAFLLVFQVLLSSKLMISITFVFLIYVVTRQIRSTYSKRYGYLLLSGLVLLFLLVVTIKNPVRDRFKDVLSGNLAMIEQEKFNTNTYFTGFQFRVLAWRITYEILESNHAFLVGVGPADAQNELVKKYLEMDMYPGDPGRGDIGFLGYNCHNQFLQTSLQSGIIGLVVLIFWCYAMIRKTIRVKKGLLSTLIIMLFAFFFIESVFERQYGVLIACFFPLLYMYARPKAE